MSADSKSKKDLINIFIALAVYIVFQFLLPYGEPLTKAGMGVLGVFFATIYLWTFVGIGWPSVLSVALLATTQVVSAGVIFQQSYGNGMVPFLIFCFVFSYAMGETGLSRRMALWFITRKFVKGKPWLIMTVFFFSILLVSLFVTSSAVGAMFLAIAEQMFENTGYKEGEKLPEATVSSIAWLAQAGQGMTPMSHAVTLLVIGLIASTLGVEVSVLKFMMVGIAFGAVFFILFMLVFRFVMRPDVERMRNLDIEYLKSTVPPMNKREKAVTVAFVLLIVTWICPDILKAIPATNGIGTFIAAMGSYVPMVLAVGLLAAIKIDSVPVVNLTEASKKLNWNSVYMMATLMLLAFVIGHENSGVTAFLTLKAGSLMGGLTPLAFVAIGIIWVLIQTNFMSNTVSGVMFSVIVPIGLTIAGVNPVALGICIAAAANFGLATPAACPVVGMVAGTPWVRPKYLLTYGWAVSLVAFISLFCVAYPLASSIFPM